MKKSVKLYPSEELRKGLAAVGIDLEAQEARKLRTLLYRRRMPPPIGASPDQMARMVLKACRPPPASSLQERPASML